MTEAGYDISGNSVDSVFEFYKEGREYSIVVKVCDQLNGQRCPIFPRTLKVLDWNLPDPAEAQGSDEEKLEAVRSIRDRIEENVKALIAEYGSYARSRKA